MQSVTPDLRRFFRKTFFSVSQPFSLKVLRLRRQSLLVYYEVILQEHAKQIIQVSAFDSLTHLDNLNLFLAFTSTAAIFNPWLLRVH